MNTTRKLIPAAPLAVEAAMAHVREFHPEVVQVFYGINGHWRYMDAESEAPEFDVCIDEEILADGANSIPTLPAAYGLYPEEESTPIWDDLAKLAHDLEQGMITPEKLAPSHVQQVGPNMTILHGSEPPKHPYPGVPVQIVGRELSEADLVALEAALTQPRAPMQLVPSPDYRALASEMFEMLVNVNNRIQDGLMGDMSGHLETELTELLDRVEADVKGK